MSVLDALFLFLSQWWVIGGIGAMIVLLFVRAQWFFANLDLYIINASFYCLQSKQTAQVREEMGQLWPFDWMLWEIWRWNFRRYIVYPTHFDDMTIFIAAQLNRNKLDLSDIVGPPTQEASQDEPPEPPAQS